MIVCDIYGSPGSGKSTAAAYVFSKLKMNSVNCELVTEVAKDIVWDGSLKMLSNQAYVFGNQFYKLSRLEGLVDVAIVDSPLMLSILYNKCQRLGASFTNMVVDAARSYDCLSYFLPFSKSSSFEDVGRVHGEDESLAISNEILHMLEKHGVQYSMISRDERSYMKVVDDVMNKLEGRIDEI